MTIISSQRYIDWDIVESKIDWMTSEGIESLDVPVVRCEIDGVEYGIVADAHHRMVAARELGLEINFVEIDNEYGSEGEELLEKMWMDSDYYDVLASDYDTYNFVSVF